MASIYFPSDPFARLNRALRNANRAARRLSQALSDEPEYLLLECETCGEAFDIIVSKVSEIDDCIRESGHEGHKFEITDYERSIYDDYDPDPVRPFSPRMR
jgi:hypothetical protein